MHFRQKVRIYLKTDIRFKTADEVYRFVSIARKCDFNIDVQCKHFFVDGKSLVGLMSIGLTNLLTIYYDGTNPVFEELLKQYAI